MNVISVLNNFVLFLLLLNQLFYFIECVPTLYTKQINPNLFRNSSEPTDQNSILGLKVLLNANKYCLGKWIESKNFTDKNHSKYLDFHGVGENQIRGPASEALGLAISLKTKAFNEKIVGKTENQAMNLTLKLLTSLAYRHRSNIVGGWGNQWQSALWASYAGLASWLVWEHFDETDRHYIENMIIYETNRFNEYKVPYYQDRHLKVIYPGDTKAEENSWNANVIQVAVAMMPSHPNWKIWMRKNIELMLSSYARHSDLNRTVVINGKKLNEWIDGSNVFENGTVVNHNRIHPDYITDIHQNLKSVLMSALAEQSVPNATYWNVELMYNAMINLKWPSPPYHKPGGSIYMRDSTGNATGDIYYPEGNDWGTHRKLCFAEFDTLIEKLTHFNKQFNANEWSTAHISAQIKLQERSTDGRTYIEAKEDTYPLREEWVSDLSGFNHLANWVNHNIKISVTNEKLD